MDMPLSSEVHLQSTSQELIPTPSVVLKKQTRSTLFHQFCLFLFSGETHVSPNRRLCSLSTFLAYTLFNVFQTIKLLCCIPWAQLPSFFWWVVSRMNKNLTWSTYPGEFGTPGAMTHNQTCQKVQSRLTFHQGWLTMSRYVSSGHSPDIPQNPGPNQHPFRTRPRVPRTNGSATPACRERFGRPKPTDPLPLVAPAILKWAKPS